MITDAGEKRSRSTPMSVSLFVETPQKWQSWLAAILNAEAAVKDVTTVSERMEETNPSRSSPRSRRKLPHTNERVIMAPM